MVLRYDSCLKFNELENTIHDLKSNSKLIFFYENKFVDPFITDFQNFQR